MITEARGVALCTKQEAMPFIQDAKMLWPCSSLRTSPWTSEPQPASLPCASPTADPLLIHGCLLQLGDVTVSRRHLDDSHAEMEITDTSVMQVQLFRDEVNTDWTDFIASPIQHLIALVPKLRRCTNLQCDFKCGLYHAAVEENFDQVIHEI